MATLTISDDTLRWLEAQASALHLPVETYLEELAAGASVLSADSQRQLAAIESFAAGVGDWSASHLPRGHQVDDRRETIYEGRGG